MHGYAARLRRWRLVVATLTLFVAGHGLTAAPCVHGASSAETSGATHAHGQGAADDGTDASHHTDDGEGDERCRCLGDCLCAPATATAAPRLAHAIPSAPVAAPRPPLRVVVPGRSRLGLLPPSTAPPATPAVALTT